MPQSDSNKDNMLEKIVGRNEIACFMKIKKGGLMVIGTVEARHSAFINPRRACAARVTVVGSVCVCVHPTSFIRPTNDTIYLTSNVNVCAVFSENAPLQS